MANFSSWLAVIVTIIAIAGCPSAAYPDLWKGSSCTSHPTTAQKNHGAPSTDASIVFVVTRGGATVTSLCPGSVYTINVTYPETRDALLTASQGSLGGTTSCPNKRVFLNTARYHITNLTLPCSATGSVALMVTSAAGQTSPFRQASSTLTVSTGCGCAPPPSPASSSGNGVVASPPPPVPNSPPPPATVGGGNSSPAPGTAPSGNTTAASPPPPAASTPIPAPPPPPTVAPSTGETDSNSGGNPPPPGSGAGANGGGSTAKCAASSLGYACSLALGGAGSAVLHWTAGGSVPPDNACTAASAATAAIASNSSDLVHFALSSTQSGYVSLAFASRAGVMSPADAIIGRIDAGAPKVEVYSLSGYDVGSLADSTWVLRPGVVAPASGGTLLCFSVAAVNAGSAPGSSSRRRRHGRALLAASLDATALALNWATNDSPDLVTHAGKGGLLLNALSGAASVQTNTERAIAVAVHGALMLAAWVLLLPLGLLTARHRWLLLMMARLPTSRVAPAEQHVVGKAASTMAAGGHGGTAGTGGGGGAAAAAAAPAKPKKKDTWYLLHFGCQVSGLALFVAGLIVAIVKLEVEAEEGPAAAHKALGWLVAGLAGLQFVVAFIRPAPDAPRRPAWNLVHHNVGRLAVLTAWAACGLGIYLAHSTYGQPLVAWLGPALLVLGGLMGADVALTVAKSVSVSR